MYFETVKKDITQITEEDIKKICEILEESRGDWVYSEIQRETGIGGNIVKKIEHKKIYKEISDNYDLHYIENSNFTVNEIKALCFHFEMEPMICTGQSEVATCIDAMRDTAYIYNITQEQIDEALLILNKKIHRDISDKFDF